MSVARPAPATLTADLDVLANSSLDEDPLSSMRAEIGVWIDTLLRGQSFEDPVFEGMVRDFVAMDEALTSVLRGVEEFGSGIDSLCHGLGHLSDCLFNHLGKSNNRSIASDTCKFRECTRSINRSDAPYSIVAKLKRDLQFNVTAPLNAHLAHNKKLKAQLDTRRRRLQEYMSARRVLQTLQDKNVPTSSQKYLQAQSTVETARAAYDEIDRPIFEWLLMLEEYQGDIYDSLLQTLKYLQYEFFAGSAHCVSYVLPTRMEFRPLVEMTPDQLEPQVEMEINAERIQLNDGRGDVGDATSKILQRFEQGDDVALLKQASPVTPAIPVDPLSLSILVNQGFEENAARQALRFHANDTQLALECILQPHSHDSPLADSTTQQEVIESVRIPSTLKWVRKLKEHRARQRQSHIMQKDTLSKDESTESDAVHKPSKRWQSKSGTRKPVSASPTSRHRKATRSDSSSSSTSSSPAPSHSERARRNHHRRFRRHRKSNRSSSPSGNLLDAVILSGLQSPIQTISSSSKATSEGDFRNSSGGKTQSEVDLLGLGNDDTGPHSKEIPLPSLDQIITFPCEESATPLAGTSLLDL